MQRSIYRKMKPEPGLGFIFRMIVGVMVVFLIWGCASGQVPDKSYAASIDDPAYRTGEGPVVCLDEAHNNFHTLANRFWAFGELLRQDGYMVEASREKFSRAVLDRCSIL